MHKQISYINVPFKTRTIMKGTVQNYLYIYKDKYEYLLIIIT